MSTALLAAPTTLLAGGVGFSRRRHPAGLIATIAVHAVLAWLLLQGDTVQRVAHQITPLIVTLRQPPAPRPEAALPALPRPRLQLPMPAVLPPPEVRVVDAPPAPSAMPAPAPALATQAPDPVSPPMAAVVEPAPVRAVVVPPAPPVLAASAIRYRVPPAIAVPMASRRLGESGTVLLRVWVDAQGLPRQVSLHRSSGFARLDEQALAAMRQARFQPVTDGGSAIEWVVIAPLQYDID